MQTCFDMIKVPLKKKKDSSLRWNNMKFCLLSVKQLMSDFLVYISCFLNFTQVKRPIHTYT